MTANPEFVNPDSSTCVVRCQQTDCDRRINVWPDSIDAVTLMSGQATITVDLKPMAAQGERLCERQDCCTGFAGATTDRSADIEWLRANVPAERVGEIALEGGELQFRPQTS